MGARKVGSGAFRIDVQRALSILEKDAAGPRWTTIARGWARAGARVPEGRLARSVIELRANGVLLRRVEEPLPGAQCFAFVDDPDLAGAIPEDARRARALSLAEEAAAALLRSSCKAFPRLVADCDPGELGEAVDAGARKATARWLRVMARRALGPPGAGDEIARAAPTARWLWDSVDHLLPGKDLARLDKDSRALFKAPLFFRPNWLHKRGPLLSLAEMERALRATGFVPFFPGDASSRMPGLVRPTGSFDRRALERVFPGALRDLTARFEAVRRRTKRRSEKAWQERVKWMDAAGF